MEESRRSTHLGVPTPSLAESSRNPTLEHPGAGNHDSRLVVIIMAIGQIVNMFKRKRVSQRELALHLVIHHVYISAINLQRPVGHA